MRLLEGKLVKDKFIESISNKVFSSLNVIQRHIWTQDVTANAIKQNNKTLRSCSCVLRSQEANILSSLH